MKGALAVLFYGRNVPAWYTVSPSTRQFLVSSQLVDRELDVRSIIDSRGWWADFRSRCLPCLHVLVGKGLPGVCLLFNKSDAPDCWIFNGMLGVGS